MADAEIAALEAELRAAQFAADVAALDRLIADDLLFTGPDGGQPARSRSRAGYTSRCA